MIKSPAQIINMMQKILVVIFKRFPRKLDPLILFEIMGMNVGMITADRLGVHTSKHTVLGNAA